MRQLPTISITEPLVNGSVHSLSSVKYYGKIDEEHQETVPEWLNKYLNKSDNQKDKKDE